MMKGVENSAESPEFTGDFQRIDGVAAKRNPFSRSGRSSLKGRDIRVFVCEPNLRQNVFVELPPQPPPRPAPSRAQIHHAVGPGIPQRISQWRRDRPINIYEIQNSFQVIGNKVPQKVRKPGAVVQFDQVHITTHRDMAGAQGPTNVNEPGSTTSPSNRAVSRGSTEILLPCGAATAGHNTA